MNQPTQDIQVNSERIEERIPLEPLEIEIIQEAHMKFMQRVNYVAMRRNYEGKIVRLADEMNALIVSTPK